MSSKPGRWREAARRCAFYPSPSILAPASVLADPSTTTKVVPGQGRTTARAVGERLPQTSKKIGQDTRRVSEWRD
jgi:hypothetical protein